jgi:hypothetical protein
MFFFISDESLKYARVFVTGKPFQLIVIFVSKAGFNIRPEVDLIKLFGE